MRFMAVMGLLEPTYIKSSIRLSVSDFLWVFLSRSNASICSSTNTLIIHNNVSDDPWQHRWLPGGYSTPMAGRKSVWVSCRVLYHFLHGVIIISFSSKNSSDSIIIILINSLEMVGYVYIPCPLFTHLSHLLIWSCLFTLFLNVFITISAVNNKNDTVNIGSNNIIDNNSIIRMNAPPTPKKGGGSGGPSNWLLVTKCL